MKLAAFLLLTACQSPTSAPDAPQAPAERREPTRFELYRLLFENAALPLSAGEHCDGVVGVPLTRPPTLADWIAYNLSVLHEGEIHLPTRCRAESGPSLEWTCDVEFQNPGGESPWNWGVRIRVGNADRRLVAGSLMCTGAG